MSTFSSVVESLTPENRKVIEDFGFDSLLHFDRCFVPNKFVKWVARHVNYRSADIVFNGKVISLTKESVHLVLGLPLSNKCFPSDPSLGNQLSCLSLRNSRSHLLHSFLKSSLIMKCCQMKRFSYVSFWWQ